MKILTTGLLAAFLLTSAASVSAQTVSNPNTWTGNVSTDWNNAGNWSAGRVPVATDNVLIQSPTQALYSPYVTSTVQANDLLLAAGAVLYLQNTGTVNVYGNFTNNQGSLVGVGRGTIALRGTGLQQINGTRTTFRNLSVGTNGAVTNAPVAVERGLTVQGPLTVGTGQEFSLLSTATGPGYVVNAGGVVNGTVNVQRYIDPSINPGLGYRHLSSPVQNTTFATLQGPGYTPVFNPAYNTAPDPGLVRPYPTVFAYDQTRVVTNPGANLSAFDKGWYSPNATDAMTPGRGYTVNLPGAANGVSGPGRVVTFTGDLTDGNLTVPTAHGPAAGQGWNLLGNPYPSPLNWDAVLSNPNTHGINQALYVFKSSGQYAGNYASYVNGIGANGGTNVLPLGQAYMIFSAAATGQVAYANSARLTSDSTLLQRTTSTPLVGARLQVSGTAGTCETVVSFTSGATNGFDAAYDALSIPVGAVRLTSQESVTNSVLAINSLPLLGTQDVGVPLSIYAATAGTYRISRTDGSLPAGFTAYLFDSQNNTVTALNNGTTVSLALSAGTTTAGRLAVVFSPRTLLAVTKSFATIGASLYPNPATGSVFVQLGERQSAATVEITNLLGQSVLRRQLAGNGTSQELPLTGIAPGVYSVRLSTATGQVAQRLVIK